jgi:two-component system NarL family response regulator
MTQRLLLVDDHAILREALRAMLHAQPDIDVVGEAGNGRDAIRLVRELNPDVVVLDVGMPDMNGIEAAAEILKRGPQIKIVALSTHSDRRFVNEMIAAGASGYVVKTAASTELIRAIHAVSQGMFYLCPEVTAGVIRQAGEDARGRSAARAELTGREREVLKLLAEGLRTTAIAGRLHLAGATVEVHRRNLMRKLDLHSVAELTRYALREGLTEL